MKRIRPSQLAALLRAAPAATSQFEILGDIAAPVALRAATAFTATSVSAPRPLTTTPFAASAGDGNESPFQKQMESIASLIGTSQMLMAQGKLSEAGALLAKGAEEAEASLGPSSMYVTPLWNQLALIQFLEGRCDEAAVAAAKASAAVKTLAVEDSSPQARGAVAAATVRHATTLVGAGRAEEAAPLLTAARTDLDAAIADINATLAGAAAEDILPFLKTFQAAAGEATYYRDLCALQTALGDEATPADVERFTDSLVASLSKMISSMGNKVPLTAVALREHSRLTMRAMSAGQGPLAEALTVQAIKLFDAYDPEGIETAGMWHQLGTLQHGLGRHEAAVESIRHAINMMEDSFEDPGANVLVAKHTLVMALGAAGRHAEAREVLVAVAPDLIQTLGEGNPLSLELDLVMTQMRRQELREEVAAGRMDAAEAAQEEERLLEETARLSKALEPYVAEYKKRADELVEDLKNKGGDGTEK